MKKYIENPKLIEKKSFEIISSEIENVYGGHEFKDKFHEHILKRVIHTTADFSYLKMLSLSENFITEFKKAIFDKCVIFTDTNMALSGINKTNLKKLGICAKCLIAEQETAEYAKENKITRSMAAVDIAFRDKVDKIFVIGNAPTALYRIMEHKEKGDTSIRCVIGVPVGFVGAKEAKEELYKSGIENITSLSRKGGSNVAASIVNAVTYELLK